MMGAFMKAIQGVYENGQIKLSEPAPVADGEPVNVLVVFPEQVEDPWQRILDDPRPRPALEKLVLEVKEEIAQGKAVPLDLDQL
jgi:predicted DNA-binding antitoxin AbrB/MazE fold protein